MSQKIKPTIPNLRKVAELAGATLEDDGLDVTRNLRDLWVCYGCCKINVAVRK